MQILEIRGINKPENVDIMGHKIASIKFKIAWEVDQLLLTSEVSTFYRKDWSVDMLFSQSPEVKI